MVRTMFNRGHALPLVLTRFLCPRISRGEYLKRPRDIDRSWPRTWQIREQEQSRNKSWTQPIRVHEQSMSALSPRSESRSQTVRIRERIAVAIVQEQALAADTNCPQTVHSVAQSMSANSSHTRILREPRLAKNCPRRRFLVSVRFPARFAVRIRTIPIYVLL